MVSTGRRTMPSIAVSTNEAKRDLLVSPCQISDFRIGSDVAGAANEANRGGRNHETHEKHERGGDSAGKRAERPGG